MSQLNDMLRGLKRRRHADCRRERVASLLDGPDRRQRLSRPALLAVAVLGAVLGLTAGRVWLFPAAALPDVSSCLQPSAVPAFPPGESVPGVPAPGQLVQVDYGKNADRDLGAAGCEAPS